MSCRAGAGAAPFFTARAKKGGSGSTTLLEILTFVVVSDLFLEQSFVEPSVVQEILTSIGVSD